MIRFTRLSAAKRGRIVLCFIEDTQASLAARLSLVNRKTVNAWYSELRGRVVLQVSQLPEVVSKQHFLAYHSRRIAKFNGLHPRARRLHMLESRVRYQLRGRFRRLVLDVSSDLLS